MNTTDKSLYEITGDIKDINTLLVGRAEIEALVRDAERLDYLQKNARCDPKMDGKHVWWPTTFNQSQKLKGATLRDAIDAAMQEKQS